MNEKTINIAGSEMLNVIIVDERNIMLNIVDSRKNSLPETW